MTRAGGSQGATSGDSTSARSAYLLAAVFFIVATVVHTWPVPTNPGYWSMHFNDDPMQNAWIVAAVAHQLLRAPLDLYHGNVFYPATDSLAYSEPLIFPGLVGAPIVWLGGSAVLLHNLLWLMGIIASGWAMFFLVHRFTGDAGAGLVSGSLFIFNSHIISRFPHLHAVHVFWIPLGVVVADRLLQTMKWRYAIALGAVVIGAATTSGHVAVYTIATLSIFTVATLPEVIRGGRLASAIARCGVAAVSAAGTLLVVLYPYFGRQLKAEIVTDGVAGLSDYVTSLSAIHTWMWGPQEIHNPLFAGILALVAAAGGAVVGLTQPAGRNRSLALTAIGLILFGFIMSFGPKTPLYGWVGAVFPPLGGIRMPARLGFLFLTGVAVLAGYGVSWFCARVSKPAAATALAAMAVVVVNVEAIPPKIPYVPFEGIPQIYERVARAPEGAVLLEVPMALRVGFNNEALYMLNSTAHWRPIVNGYGSSSPDEYVSIAEHFYEFPSTPSLNLMLELRVTHVMLHEERLGRERMAEIVKFMDSQPYFDFVSQDDGGRRLYRFRFREYRADR